MSTTAHYIYIITNNINQKKYIGQTLNPKRRWMVHRTICKPLTYIDNTIAKYGVTNFSFAVIAECWSQAEADELEILLIRLYSSIDKNYGYNIKPGGKVSYGWSHTEETKRKISEAEKGKIMSDESRIKMSKSQKKRPRAPIEFQRMSETKKQKALLKFNSMVINDIQLAYAAGETMACLARRYKTRNATMSKIIRTGSI